MSTMTAHAYLRNDTAGALTVHDSAHPSPDTVESGAVVRVDQWAAKSLLDSGFSKAKAADWTDPLAPVEDEPADAIPPSVDPASLGDTATTEGDAS